MKLLQSSSFWATKRETRRYLFIEELSGVFLDVSFIQVCGQTHQTDLWETEVCQLDVTHGRDEEAADRIWPKQLDNASCNCINVVNMKSFVSEDELAVCLCLTCQVWGLCGRCRSCGDTPTRGRSLRSTYEPYRPAALRCSSAAWRSLHLQGAVMTSNTTQQPLLLMIKLWC